MNRTNTKPGWNRPCIFFSVNEVQGQQVFAMQRDGWWQFVMQSLTNLLHTRQQARGERHHSHDKWHCSDSASLWQRVTGTHTSSQKRRRNTKRGCDFCACISSNTVPNEYLVDTNSHKKMTSIQGTYFSPVANSDLLLGLFIISSIFGQWRNERFHSFIHYNTVGLLFFITEFQLFFLIVQQTVCSLKGWSSSLTVKNLYISD